MTYLTQVTIIQVPVSAPVTSPDTISILTFLIAGGVTLFMGRAALIVNAFNKVNARHGRSRWIMELISSYNFYRDGLRHSKKTAKKVLLPEIRRFNDERLSEARYNYDIMVANLISQKIATRKEIDTVLRYCKLMHFS